MVLERIIRRKRREVAERKAARDLASLRADAEPSDRGFEQALARPRRGYILECKKASPSRGLICPGRDAVEIVSHYAPFADAFSVLCDGPDFGGSLDDLAAVREAYPQPVLCKDFVVDPYQVYEARTRGADAILLMLSVLDDAGFRACFAAAQELNMGALVEVHDQRELERAEVLGARVIGINNRNLKDLKVDLATTERLAPRAPKGRIIVGESGLFTRADTRRLEGLCDAFLVGTALLLSGEPDRAVRELIFGRAKVCGLTRPEDAAAAWAAGATYGGLIFAEESPRCVSLSRARAVRAGAPLSWVGVFVNAEQDRVLEAARSLELGAVQLHGEESEAYIRELKPRLPEGCELWRAARVRGALPSRGGADRLLLDAYSAGARGGTGARFDWSALDGVEDKDSIIVAGGITAENAAEAGALGAFAIDVSSGVESAPGQKDAAKIAALFRALRG